MLFLSVCICDDYTSHAEQLMGVIDLWSAKRNVEICYKRYVNPLDFDAHDIATHDIVFMDIELDNTSDMNGIKIARRTRELGYQVPIVFVTNYKQYIFECNGITALDFLEKPVSSEYCEICLDRALETRSQSEASSIIVGKTKVITDRVLYIEAQGHSTVIHLLTSKIRQPRNLADVLSLFPPQQIIQIHRSYAANIKYISNVDKDVILDSGQHLPISRERKQQVKRLFFEHSWRTR